MYRRHVSWYRTDAVQVLVSAMATAQALVKASATATAQMSVQALAQVLVLLLEQEY